MPPLPKYFRTLLDAGPLPLSTQSAEYLETLDVARARTVARQAVDLLGDGMGHVLVRLGVRQGEVPAPVTAAALTAQPGFAAIAQGRQGSPSLDPAVPGGELLRLCQRALQAAGARVQGAPRELLLPAWGADGEPGDETRAAVIALQRWQRTNGAPGRLGPPEATALLRLLGAARTPDLWAALPARPALPSAPARRLIEIARGIVAATPERPFVRRVDGSTYSYSAADFAVVSTRSGTLRAPGGVAYTLRPGNDYWKCNVFGGTCLALAELPVPTFQYAPGSARHFPRTERFGDRLADKAGWKLLRYLDHRDPADPTRPVVGAAQDAQIRELLQQARGGDMLFVDHPGEAGEDGGHTRVCVDAAAAGDADVAPLFAQARYEGAREQRDGMALLSGGRELCFWLLRYGA